MFRKVSEIKPDKNMRQLWHLKIPPIFQRSDWSKINQPEIGIFTFQRIQFFLLIPMIYIFRLF